MCAIGTYPFLRRMMRVTIKGILVLVRGTIPSQKMDAWGNGRVSIAVGIAMLGLTGLTDVTLGQKMVGPLTLLGNANVTAVAILVGSVRSGIRTTIVVEMCTGEAVVHPVRGSGPIGTIGMAGIVIHEHVGMSIQHTGTEIDPVLLLLDPVEAHLQSLTGTLFLPGAWVLPASPNPLGCAPGVGKLKSCPNFLVYLRMEYVMLIVLGMRDGWTIEVSRILPRVSSEVQSQAHYQPKVRSHCLLKQ